MEETNKLPLKRVELSLSKFNEVAIPHHLDLLRQHKANIIKYEESGDWARVRNEQTHAKRVASQLRSLLAEMETLRRQVAPEDHSRFDALTQRSRDLTLKSIVDYLETTPLHINRRVEETRQVAGSALSTLSTDSVGVVAHAPDAQPELIQLQVDADELAVREREAVLRGWCELQCEVHALHETWHHMHRAAQLQRDQVGAAQASVHVAADNVQAARAHLSTAERLQAGAYGVGGAALGALAGGPVGLLIGAKAGAVALLAGSAVGYWGARLLGRRRQLQLEDAPSSDATEEKEDKKSQ